MASLVNRYTAALLGATEAEGSTEPVAEDLQVLGIALEDRNLRLLLENPGVPRGRKVRVLDSILRIGDREPHERTSRFLAVVLDRGRQRLLSEVARAFRGRALDLRGVVEGRVDTALPLETGDLARLEQSLGRILGKKVVLEVRSEPDLLGGFRVRIGDRMFDASLEGRIEALGRRLKGIPIEALRAAGAGDGTSRENHGTTSV